MSQAEQEETIQYCVIGDPYIFYQERYHPPTEIGSLMETILQQATDPENPLQIPHQVGNGLSIQTFSVCDGEENGIEERLYLTDNQYSVFWLIDIRETQPQRWFWELCTMLEATGRSNYAHIYVGQELWDSPDRIVFALPFNAYQRFLALYTRYLSAHDMDMVQFAYHEKPKPLIKQMEEIYGSTAFQENPNLFIVSIDPRIRDQATSSQ